MPSRWELLEVERPRLLRLARRRTASEQDAEDVVAEALVRAMERTTLDEDRLAAWLTTVTVRLCVDVVRHRGREHRHWARAGAQTVTPSCEQVVCDRAEAAWIAQRVTELPGRQARALSLRAAGLDVAGVARLLGVSQHAAESLLARGRLAMRALLGLSAAAVLFAWRWAAGVARAGGAVAVGTTSAVGATGVVVAAVLVQGGSAPPNAAALPAPPAIQAPAPTAANSHRPPTSPVIDHRSTAPTTASATPTPAGIAIPGLPRLPLPQLTLPPAAAHLIPLPSALPLPTSVPLPAKLPIPGIASGPLAPLVAPVKSIAGDLLPH
jgi:RNA polymerase sigma factor (sigma-70 family)